MSVTGKGPSGLSQDLPHWGEELQLPIGEGGMVGLRWWGQSSARGNNLACFLLVVLPTLHLPVGHIGALDLERPEQPWNVAGATDWPLMGGAGEGADREFESITETSKSRTRCSRITGAIPDSP